MAYPRVTPLAESEGLARGDVAGLELWWIFADAGARQGYRVWVVSPCCELLPQSRGFLGEESHETSCQMLQEPWTFRWSKKDSALDLVLAEYCIVRFRLVARITSYVDLLTKFHMLKRAGDEA